MCRLSHAHDSERIDQLEQEIESLKVLLSILMIAQAATSEEMDAEEADSAKNTDAKWAKLENWRRLKRNMSYEQVRNLLGEPEQVSGGAFTRWSYPDLGSVTFYDDKVHGWHEPHGLEVPKVDNLRPENP